MSENKFVAFNTKEDFQNILFMSNEDKFDHVALCRSLMEGLKREYQPFYYTDTRILSVDDPDENDKFSIYYNLHFLATGLFHAYNYRIFRQGDLDSLDELLTVRCDRSFEKYVKFLAMLMLSQEFFAMKVAVENYTNSDFWNCFENMSILNSRFMNLYVAHYLYHTKYAEKKILHLFENKTMVSEAKIKKTFLFGQQLTAKFSSIVNSDHFDEFQKPFFEAWANLKGVTLEDMKYSVNESINHGTHAVNPIARMIHQYIETDPTDSVDAYN